MKYKFIIKYHYERYNTGNVYEKTHRVAEIYAEDVNDATNKLKKLDSKYICIAENGLHIIEIEDIQCPNTNPKAVFQSNVTFDEEYRMTDDYNFEVGV